MQVPPSESLNPEKILIKFAVKVNYLRINRGRSTGSRILKYMIKSRKRDFDRDV
jgi:hypothetical protein